MDDDDILAGLKDDNAQLNQEICALKLEKYNIEAKFSDRESEFVYMKKLVQTMKAEIKDLKHQMGNLNTKMYSVTSECNSTKALLKAACEERDALKEELDSVTVAGAQKVVDDDEVKAIREDFMRQLKEIKQGHLKEIEGLKASTEKTKKGKK